MHPAAAMKYAHDSRPFIQMLLERGADPRIRATNGKTAAEMAEEHGRKPGEHRPFKEIAAMLREAET